MRIGGAGTTAREEVMGAGSILEAMDGGVELGAVGAGEGSRVPAPLLVGRAVDIEGQLLTFSELIEGLEQTVEGQEDHLAEPLMPRKLNQQDAKVLDDVSNTRRSMGKSLESA